ncbi:MAG: hypothetical protein IJU14_01330 [Clostridia bacterium]|jgi:hypothetical protein|nr:hypothetical protein [Clostridia bacterium]
MQNILQRVQNRLNDDTVSENTLSEIIQTISDRVCLRLGTENIPTLFYSIVTDASVKLYRRTFYEGISTENDDGITTSFVDDILEEYTAEFEQYKLNRKTETGIIKFL